MHFDPLEFPLLDETLIPPPQQLVPSLDEPAPSTEQEDEAAHVADEGGYAEAAAGHAETVGGQEDLIGEQSGAREPDVKQALPDGPYDAYWDPSLPYYMPRNSRGVVDFSHHRRKCLVCRHAYRAVIEHDYLTWRDPAEIARDCGFRDARPILRHAEAMGLDRHRARRITSALERLIHKASSATPSAGSIVSAIKLYAQMTGSWTPPPRQVEVTHIRRVAREGAIESVREGADPNAREDASNSPAADARLSVREDIGGEVRREAHESASRGVAQAVGDGVSHDVSEGVREVAGNGARHGASSVGEQGIRHDVGEAAGDAARGSMSHDLRDDACRCAREDASHSFRDEPPKEIHEKDLTETSSDSLVAATVAEVATSRLRTGAGARHGVGDRVDPDVREVADNGARHGVRHNVLDEAPETVPGEAPEEVSAAPQPDSATDEPSSLVAATVADHATSRLRIGGGPRPSRTRALAGSFLSPPESPNDPRPPLAFSLLGPEIDGEPRPPLGPEVQISNQLPRRLESDVSP